MGHVAARHFDQIGHQIVAALELHVDLPERIGDAVARHHQTVVGHDGPSHDGHGSCQQYPANHTHESS
ncbi:hypothetical protein D3C80_2066990 [compost metagenome]